MVPTLLPVNWRPLSYLPAPISSQRFTLECADKALDTRQGGSTQAFEGETQAALLFVCMFEFAYVYKPKRDLDGLELGQVQRAAGQNVAYAGSDRPIGVGGAQACYAEILQRQSGSTAFNRNLAQHGVIDWGRDSEGVSALHANEFAWDRQAQGRVIVEGTSDRRSGTEANMDAVFRGGKMQNVRCQNLLEQAGFGRTIKEQRPFFGVDMQQGGQDGCLAAWRT